MEKYKVNWTSKSRKDITKIYNYLLYHFEEADTARSLYSKIINAVSKLTCFPERYPDISYYGNFNKQCRRLRVDKFIIIYKIDFKSREVYVLHIFHSKQNYLNLI